MSVRPQIAKELAPLIEDLKGALITDMAMLDIVERWKSAMIPHDSLNRLITAATLEAMERELIMALTRWDDEKNLSFPKLLKQQSSLGVSQSEFQDLNKLATKFRASINTLKTPRRNSYIAHLSSRFTGELPEVASLTPLIHEACELVSAFLGEPWTYQLTLQDRTEPIHLYPPQE